MREVGHGRVDLAKPSPDLTICFLNRTALLPSFVNKWRFDSIDGLTKWLSRSLVSSNSSKKQIATDGASRVHSGDTSR
jgi:hypothetical protein